jgi:hypothetical protein
VVQEMAEAVHKTGNVVLIDTYAQKTALRVGVSPEAMRVEFKRASRSKNAITVAEPESGETVSNALPPPGTPEYWLLKLVFLNEDSVGWVQAHLEIDWIQHSVVRQILLLRLAAHAGENWRGIATFLDECESPEMRSLVTEAAAEERTIPNPAQQLGDIVLRLRNQFIDRQLAALTQRSSQPEIGDEERLQCFRRQQELRQMKRQPLVALNGGSEEPF